MPPLPRCEHTLSFLSTPSARRATVQDAARQARYGISIHALREEGDSLHPDGEIACKIFLSTPSARRATSAPGVAALLLGYFYPRPPRGGRPTTTTPTRSARNFYPRPPRGGRPPGDLRERSGPQISIHALREEGDRHRWPHRDVRRDFYPRPPRGGRPGTDGRIGMYVEISIHALREEGDAASARFRSAMTVFLSTPSARRAT